MFLTTLLSAGTFPMYIFLDHDENVFTLHMINMCLFCVKYFIVTKLIIKINKKYRTF